MKRLKDFEVIRNSDRFSRLYKSSKKNFGDEFVLFYKTGEKKEVGFTASKKIGNAVKRNFAKRRMRALFVEISNCLKKGSYIIVARESLLVSDYGGIKNRFIKSLKRLNVYDSECW